MINYKNIILKKLFNENRSGMKNDSTSTYEKTLQTMNKKTEEISKYEKMRQPLFVTYNNY